MRLSSRSALKSVKKIPPLHASWRASVYKQSTPRTSAAQFESRPMAQ
jgi:hypothetical protein